MRDENSVFVTFELDGHTGNIISIHPGAQNDQQCEVINNALKRICQPKFWDWIKHLIHFAGRQQGHKR